MLRHLPYILLFFTIVALQIFVFDRMLLSTMVSPLVYIVFIALLPMQRSQLEMLMWGVAFGVTFDLLMGTAGVNSIAAIFISYVRHSLFLLTVDRDVLNIGGAPTFRRIGIRRFLIYITLFITLHSAVFFSFEFLNFDEWGFLLQRIIFSSAVTILFAGLIATCFDQLLSHRY